MRTVAVVLLAVVGLFVPTVQAESVPYTTHVHLFDFWDAPLSPQPMPADFVFDAMYGPATNTLTCLHPLTGPVTHGTTSQAFHTTRGYAYPGVVEYGEPNANGHPRLHMANGVYGNISIDTTSTPALHWFVRAAPGLDALGGPVPVPNVAVQAALHGGSGRFSDEPEGRLLFSGSAGPATLVGDQVLPGEAMQGEVRWVGDVAGSPVYEFIAPLAPGPDPAILLMEGYKLRVDLSMQVPFCDPTVPDQALMLGFANAFNGPGFRPHIAWDILDPMATASISLSRDKVGRVVADYEATTVFGPVDVANLAVSMTRADKDGSHPVGLVEHTFPGYGPCGHDCGHVTETTYTLDVPVPSEPEPGVYELRVSYDNLQGTAHRDLVATLTIEPRKESPGPGAPLLIGLLVAALALARRAGPR